MGELTAGKKALFAAIPLIAAIVVMLVGAEIYVRYKSPYGYITPEIVRSMTPDYVPAVFARHVIQPAAKRVVVNGQELFRINSHGYRGEEFAIDKPAGVTRVMFYGGSSVFDAEARGEDDWPHRVERLLHRDGLSNVEVINAGIPGFASSDAVGTFFAEGHRFAPDYVVLYDEWNDIKLLRSNNTLLRDFAREDVPADPRTTYQNALDRFLCNVSQLYVRLRDRYYTWKLRVGDEGMKPAGDDYSGTISASALAQYKLNVETFVDIARNIGAEPVLMIEARLVARDNTPAEKARISYDYVLMTHEKLCDAFDAQDQIIRTVAREKGVRLIDPTREVTGRDELFANHIHLNAQGSARLAEVVAREFVPILQTNQ
jgi:hypothetical protein